MTYPLWVPAESFGSPEDYERVLLASAKEMLDDPYLIGVGRRVLHVRMSGGYPDTEIVSSVEYRDPSRTAIYERRFAVWKAAGEQVVNGEPSWMHREEVATMLSDGIAESGRAGDIAGRLIG